MPIKKKKHIKKQKITTSSYITTKRSSKRTKHEKNRNKSETSIDKRPCASSRIVDNKLNTLKHCEKEGLKRIYSPYNKLARISDSPEKYQPTKMPYQSTYQSTGLSPKERSYVICSCQTRSKRYASLKSLAEIAIKENKIFSVYGCCSAVRKALTERGWVEKIPPCKMNLSKIRNSTFSSKNAIYGELEKLLLSNLVEKYNANFIWQTKDEQRDTAIDMNKEKSTALVNKLKIDAMWTTKQGLCSSMKRNYWFYIEDVAEVNGPRTYNCYDVGETEGFVKDYKITACTSLLKWILSMVANDRPIFHSSGRVSLNVIVFAINRCKEYLFRKQNKDIDRPASTASAGQWNGFLKKYYRIIGKDDIFNEDKDNKLALYLGYAKFLLKEMHKYRPQLSCEGCHNIWIIKPANCSRGIGIRMASKLGVITNLLNNSKSKYVAQKYIEEPLLIHDTKFDIRQYYLVTSTYPLVIWMYKDCYLKFSSQKYNLKNYHESIHLTNNAVQKRYTNCFGRHYELPQNNMWDSDMYRDYLNRIGKERAWDKVIYPGMKKSIIGIMLSCQDSLTVCKNRFELYGCDFILDKEYKPWLIEINSCPDLNHTTPVTAKICPAVVADIIKVVIDYQNNPKSPTGKFECIYRQPMSMPKYGGAADLAVRGFGLPLDYFYRGKIELKESFDDADIGKQRDIKVMLDKMKQFYDTDIMMEPEDDHDSSVKIEQETCTHSTSSEYELNVAATVITEQLEDLMDRITSEHSDTSKSSITGETKQDLSSVGSLKYSKRSVTSLTDIRTLLVKGCSRQTSETVITDQVSRKDSRRFKFSDLNDGPYGKGSDVQFQSIRDVFREISSSLEIHNLHGNKTNKRATSKSQSKNNNIMQATNRIISFIHEKENEYSIKPVDKLCSSSDK